MSSSLLFGPLAVLFAAKTVATLFQLRWVQRLPSLGELEKRSPQQNSDSPPVRCSIVLAARDEEARVENTVRHLLAQTGVQVEIIVVDDRSTDATGKILQRLSQEDARVRTARVDVLPENWLGKCHACHVGANMATGEWLLFTDADCWMQPGVIARALRVAEIEQAQHITLTPGVAPETAPAMAWHLAFLLTIADWVFAVNRDKPKAYLGMGAFNLIKTSTYRDCGGHELLRLAVLDDVKLGLLVRRAGKRTRAFIGGDDVLCHWGTTARQMIKIMEKNYFAALEYRTGVALAAGFGSLLIWSAIAIGVFAGGSAGILAGLSLLSLAAPAAVFAQRLRWPLWPALLTPFMMLALFYAVLNSTIVTLCNGGISWRGTFYPLETLRRAARPLQSP